MVSCTTSPKTPQVKEIWIPDSKKNVIFRHYDHKEMSLSDPKSEELVCISMEDFIYRCSGPL